MKKRTAVKRNKSIPASQALEKAYLELARAIENDDLATVDRLSDALALLRCEYELDRINTAQPLAYAAHLGRVDCVKLLLSKGAVVHGGGELTISPLQAAANNDHHEVCEVLMQAGADPYRCAGVQYEAMEIACGKENEIVFNALLRAETAQLALDCAARFGFTKGCELALGADAKVNGRVNGRTALVWAVRAGNVEVVRLLLARKAKPNLGSGEAAALYWIFRCCYDGGYREKALVAALLLTHGLLFPRQDRLKFAGLCRDGDCVELAQALIDGHHVTRDELKKVIGSKKAADVRGFLVAGDKKATILGRAAHWKAKGAAAANQGALNAPKAA